MLRTTRMDFVWTLMVVVQLLIVGCAQSQAPGDCDCSGRLQETDVVCGTDNRTYQNQCQLKCQTSATNADSSGVEVKHRGRCLSNNNSCHAQRTMALIQQRLTPGITIVPECTENGLFKAIQCHQSTGYCWCVGSADGKPVPGSSVRHRKPNCDELSKFA